MSHLTKLKKRLAESPVSSSLDSFILKKGMDSFLILEAPSSRQSELEDFFLAFEYHTKVRSRLDGSVQFIIKI